MHGKDIKYSQGDGDYGVWKIYIGCGSLGELPLKSSSSKGVTNKKVNCGVPSANNQGYLDFDAPNSDYPETWRQAVRHRKAERQI